MDDEGSGLLRDEHPVTPSATVASPVSSSSNARLPRGVIICITIFFFSSLYELVTIAPTTALFQASTCREYYRLHDPDAILGDGSVPESMCRIDPVQRELVFIRSWKAIFDGIPVFIVATFLDRLVKRFSPTKILLGSLVGVTASTVWMLLICSYSETLPLRLVWLSSIFLFFGGGLSQVSAMVHLLASEYAGRLETSQAFHYLNAVYMLDELIAPGIASITMATSLWVPFGLALLSLVASMCMIRFLPTRSSAQSYDPLENSLVIETGDITSSISTDSGCRIRSVSDVFKHRNLLLSLPVLFFAIFKFAVLRVLLQVISLRFEWTLSGASASLSAISAFNLILFLVIVPRWMYKAQHDYAIRPDIIDLRVVRYTLLAASIGSLFMSFAPSVLLLVAAGTIFAAAAGIRPPMLALATAWVSSEDRPRLYGIIQVVENIAIMISDPLMQNALGLVLKLPRFWYGMPFFVASVLYSIAYSCSRLMALN